MARVSKLAKRAVRRAFGAGRAVVLAVTPGFVRETLTPAARYFHILLVDHTVIRLVFPNRHPLSPVAWRSAQPLPHQIRALPGMGIRTVVNLRGGTDTPTYELEREACARAGLKLVDFRVRSRAAPSRAELIAVRELFKRLDYPILMHCKSGADRVGLMSVLYLHFQRDVPIEEAKRQLSIAYGHLRQADTGILDHIFDRYLEAAAGTTLSFNDWVETVYDAAEITHSFHAQRWANRIVNGLLRRE